MTGGRLGQKPKSVRLRWRALRSVFRSRFGPAVYGVTHVEVGLLIPKEGWESGKGGGGLGLP